MSELEIVSLTHANINMEFPRAVQLFLWRRPRPGMKDGANAIYHIMWGPKGKKARQRPMRMLYLAREYEFIDVLFKNIESHTENLTRQVIPQGHTSVQKSPVKLTGPRSKGLQRQLMQSSHTTSVSATSTRTRHHWLHWMAAIMQNLLKQRQRTNTPPMSQINTSITANARRNVEYSVKQWKMCRSCWRPHLGTLLKKW